MINTIIIQKNLLLLFLLGVSLNSFGEINRYIRYTQNNLSSYGVIIDNKVHQLTKAPYLGGVKTGKTANLDKIILLAPAEPSKVIAVGYNYHSHRGDMELPAHPPIFLKLPTSIIATNESIIYPNGATDVHYEAELVVVMGKTASKVSKEDAENYIFGVTAGNDVSERNWQANDLQWFRGKAADTFAPLGPEIVTGLNYKDLLVQSRLNGKIMQSQRTQDHIHDIDAIVSHISQTVTLFPGDVIYTGTPGSTTAMVPGDIIEIEVEGVGILRNTISK
ncbi:MAG: fumarylacetoacetate hydrolase family protein [Woeseiaceae bacterium]|jgi:2-keto-4-pentenoate hydratase/2-oxohepta-3-ene-1,7-dioic acid hydratase in catechol pathway|nr:fumarylacetoacetate hydrolase family protein [Woeseiaceae bacterium]